MKTYTNYPFLNVVARSTLHIFEFQMSIIISEIFFIKKLFEKKVHNKVISLYSNSNQYIQGHLIIIHIWAKGTQKKHHYITKVSYHTLHLPNLVLWYVIFYKLLALLIDLNK
jgi:hypothetical protein